MSKLESALTVPVSFVTDNTLSLALSVTVTYRYISMTAYQTEQQKCVLHPDIPGWARARQPSSDEHNSWHAGAEPAVSICPSMSGVFTGANQGVFISCIPLLMPNQCRRKRYKTARCMFCFTGMVSAPHVKSTASTHWWYVYRVTTQISHLCLQVIDIIKFSVKSQLIRSSVG